MQISPSILAADFANLERELTRISSADWAHIDVMDGHFVPNLTLGLPVVQALADISPVPLDVHLMIEDPDRWAPQYAEAGARSVTFHVEAAADVAATARSIRSAGARAAIALKPDTSFEPYAGLLTEIDMVLVMTVEPGFGGQSFMADQMTKVTQVRRAVDRAGVPVSIEVDGGISADTIGACAQAGADVFVAGSAVYGQDDPGAAVQSLRDAAERCRGGAFDPS
ncbi:MAG: ribulose-phosphate 3-epimerase [Ornithinimicrobium sp.]